MDKPILDLEDLLSQKTQANLTEARKKTLEERRAKVVKRSLQKNFSGEPHKVRVRSKSNKTADKE